MTRGQRTGQARAARRDLLAELDEELRLADKRQGKRTLKSHAGELRAPPRITSPQLEAQRETLNLLRAHSAAFVWTNAHTLEK